MNKRIQELAKQSDCSIDGMGYGEGNLENFAELIVLECTKAVMDGTKEGDHYAQRIEEHFDNSPGGIIHFGVES